ncbi:MULTISPECIES: hypothetical protein [Flavobacteriaceae]|uniref:hypothetical protein n=1 Tax=Flavobacteriaceae TaxID=49546 RepID=UPI001491EC3C|nr:MULTISPECIES: hypothetical protein [Allomuricauda]MDC6364929.1 hypothetical protein [Muricauda sp. AC10]
MRKVVCILAVVAMGMGMMSCEADTDVQDTESLFEALDQESTDKSESDAEGRN